MGRRLFQIPQPLNGDEEWLLVSFCIPDTPSWRRLIVGWGDTLTYGVAYDEQTGNIKQAQAVGREIFNSMSMCNLKDQLKVQRMLVAAIVGEAVDLTDPAQLSPDNVDYTQTGVVPNLNRYLQHLQVLGAIPGAGDSIQTSLWKLVDSTGWDDRTIDELTAEIAGLDPGLLDTLSDLANLLIAYKAIFPGTTKVTVAHSFYEKLQSKRYWHNHLSLQAYQATALRGIQRALAPFDEDPAEDDQSTLDKIFSIPFLSKALVAVVEPTPAGEITLVGSLLSGVVKDIFDVIRGAWDLWWNKWLNRVETPVPVDTVTGNLTAIADAIAKIEPQDQTEIDNGDIPAAINSLAAILGIEGAALVAAITGMQAQVTVNSTCESCGGSGGGGCGCGNGGTDAPTDPGVEGEPPPPGFTEPIDQPGSSGYQSKKCKVANFIQDQFRGYFVALDAYNIDGMSAVSIVLLTTGLAELATPFPLVDGFIGAVVGLLGVIAAIVIKNTIDFGGLVTIMDNNRDALVCALYESDGSSSALAAYQDVLTAGGANTAQITFVNAIYAAEALNYLYFGGKASVEAAIQSYNPTGDCSNCGDPPVDPCDYTQIFHLDGLDGWAIDTGYNNVGVWTLEHHASSEQLRLTATDGASNKAVRVIRMFLEPFNNAQGNGYGFFSNWDAGSNLTDVQFSLVDQNGVDLVQFNTSGYGPEQVQQTITNLDNTDVWGLAVRVQRSNGTVYFRLHDISLVCCQHSIPVGLQNEPYGQIVTDNGSTMTIQALADSDGTYRANVHLRNGCLNHTVSGFSVSGVIDATGIATDLFRLSSPAGGVGDVYSDDAMPPGSYDNVFAVHVLSSQPFSVTFNYQPYDEVP